MQRSRIILIIVAVVAILGGGTMIGAGLRHAGSAANAASTSQNAGSAQASPSPTGPSAADLEKARAAQLDAALQKLAATSAPFSVSVLNKKTGQEYSFHGTTEFDTASIVKAQILACLLLHDQAAGHAPTSQEMSWATPMIQNSNNDAATALFKHVGGAPAVNACNQKLGLTETTVNSAWGFTRTTSSDQVKLLSQLVATNGPLSAASRQTAFSLMSTVEKDQQWGIPSLRRAGETAIVKNGWDTRSKEGGLWAINTIGRLTAPDGHVDVSVAVLSHLNKTDTAGYALVQQVAALTRQYLQY